MSAACELSRSLMFFVDHEGFSQGRGYVPLALFDHGYHEDAEFVFVNDRGETRFVDIRLCHHVAPSELSQSR
jgi:hypothetical protein